LDIVSFTGIHFIVCVLHGERVRVPPQDNRHSNVKRLGGAKTHLIMGSSSKEQDEKKEF